MSEVSEVSLDGFGTAKLRKPGMVLLLDLVTLGVFGCIWYYQVNRELMLLGRARHATGLGENPTRSLLAIVPGYVLLLPAAISIRNMIGRLRTAQELAGLPESDYAGVWPLFPLLFFLPPVGSSMFQKRLNDVWLSELAAGRVTRVDASRVS